MSRDSTISNGLLAARNAFQDGHALLHELVGLYVQEVCAGQAVLGNENGLFVPLDVSKQLCRLTLECGDKFGAHGVTLKYHSGVRKCRCKDLIAIRPAFQPDPSGIFGARGFPLPMP